MIQSIFLQLRFTESHYQFKYLLIAKLMQSGSYLLYYGLVIQSKIMRLLMTFTDNSISSEKKNKNNIYSSKPSRSEQI